MDTSAPPYLMATMTTVEAMNPAKAPQVLALRKKTPRMKMPTRIPRTRPMKPLNHS